MKAHRPTAITLTALLCLASSAAWTADQTKTLKDIVYAHIGERALHLNLTIPTATSKPRPAIIWFHGGGWQAGHYAEDPAAQWGLDVLGYVTGSVEYRLSQEAPYPAQIQDCKAAIRYLRANAKQYGIDPDRIGVWGGSAGGHLVALLGTTGGIRVLEGEVGVTGCSSRVQAVCDLFGPTDLTPLAAKDYTPVVSDMIDGLLGGPARQRLGIARLASPVEFVSKDDPPFLIVHGDKDTLVPMSQSEELERGLRRVGVDVKLVRVKNGGHGFGPTGTEPALAEIQKLVRDFFRAKLGE